MSAYPPSPWRLQGRIVATVLLVPVSDLATPPPGTRIVRLGRWAVVVAAFFRYEEPSPLTYEELMATVLVRRGWRPRVWIPWIWVDSEASLAGGRELWAIPKDLATFDVEPDRVHVARGLGSVALSSRRRRLGRWPVGFRVVQERDGHSVVTPVGGRVELEAARARWSFSGDLAALDRSRRLLTVTVPRFHLTFGSS